MSIQKKNDKYVPVVYLGKNADGKKMYKWGNYWDKRKDAVKEEAEMTLDKDNLKKSLLFGDVYFENLADQFFKLVAPHKYTPYTLEQHTYNFNKYILPAFKGKKIEDIEPMHIQKFINLFADLSPATVRKIFYFLKVILDSGVKWQMIRMNPCIGAELPSLQRKKKINTWTTSQIKAFLSSENVKENKIYGAILLSFYTGMRPGEVCGLKWSSIEDDTISVVHGIDKKDRSTNLKNDSSYNRKIYIDANIQKVLKLQKKYQLNNKILFADSYAPSDYVFTHENGTVINPDYFSKTFNKLIAQYNQLCNENLPRIRLYDARHSFATNAIELGIEVSVVAEIMGHASTQTTYENYVHVREEPIKKAISDLSKMMS